MQAPPNLLGIDIGNTRAKAAVYSDGQLLANGCGEELTLPLLMEWKGRFGLRHAMLSAVAENAALSPAALEQLFTMHYPSPASLPHIRLRYQTPQTLGADRLACMAGAAAMYPGRNVLVLQCGTCLTSDLLTSDGVYAGGGIAPGLQLRFKALHAFTSRLPLVEADTAVPLAGDSTKASIQAGVWHGYLSECEGLIQKYQAVHEDLMVILTGGDASAVKDKLKMCTFAQPNLVLFGLTVMLRYDIDKQ